MNKLFQNLEVSLCKSRVPTLQEIELYKQEPDPEKRLDMIYEYQIPQDDMIEGDYTLLMNDMYGEHNTIYENTSMLDMMKAQYIKDGIKFEPNDENCGDLISLEEWLNCVKFGAFIDYDGYGDLATETHTSNIVICPSEAKNYSFPEWATHIMWYNR